MPLTFETLKKITAGNIEFKFDRSSSYIITPNYDMKITYRNPKGELIHATLFK